MTVKRFGMIVAVLLCVALLMGSAASAETVYYGTMVVVNCEEWVSLRDVPGTGGNRLAKVPLGAVVTDAEWAPIMDQFVYCRYDGQWGYILRKYLEQTEYPEPEEPGEASVVLDQKVGGLHVLAEHSYVGAGEQMRVTCVDEQGGERWLYESETGDTTELTMIDAFIGGTAQDPMLLVYNAEKGLTALDIATGETRWTLADTRLGASISRAVGDDGTAYIGGYYGPDPVAIDVNGNVLWRADSGDCYWLYEIAIADDTLVCRYDMMDGDDAGPGTVVFSLDGKLLEKRVD